MDIQSLEQLPDEIVCEIVSNITDDDTIMSLINSSSRIRNIAKSCIINMYGDYLLPELILLFPNIINVAYIDITNVGQVNYIASLPKLKSAALDNEVTGDLDPEFVPNMASTFINTYAYRYEYIDNRIIPYIKNFDDTYFYFSSFEPHKSNFSNGVVIKGNQYKKYNSSPGVSLYFRNRGIQIFKDLFDIEIAHIIGMMYTIQNTHKSNIMDIFLDTDHIFPYTLDIISSFSRNGRRDGIGLATTYNISNNVQLFTTILKVVRRLKIYVNTEDITIGLNIDDMIERIVYKHVEYLDGPFDIKSFLNNINHKTRFPNLITVGFYLTDLHDIELIETLNPHIKNVILYVPDNLKSIPEIQSQKNISIVSISEIDDTIFELLLPEYNINI